MNRREIMSKSVLAVGSLIATGKVSASCLLTPEQTEGPFYPIEDQADKDNDLTRVQGKSAVAEGEVVILKGVVRDGNCQPVAGVLVEIWQACHSGKYNHPGDPNPAVLDPNFQYWGRAVTNAKGEYAFKTIRPGQYRATRDWVRPAHIHMKVHRRGFEELTTLVYFKDDRFNSTDRILQSLSTEEKESVVVDFKQPINGNIREGIFDISIRSF